MLQEKQPMMEIHHKFSVPLKDLSNFWKTLDIPLINCEVSLTLTWPKNCILTDVTTKDLEEDNPAIDAVTGVTFTMTDAKLHVPAVNLSTKDDNKLSAIKNRI